MGISGTDRDDGASIAEAAAEAAAASARFSEDDILPVLVRRSRTSCSPSEGLRALPTHSSCQEKFVDKDEGRAVPIPLASMSTLGRSSIIRYLFFVAALRFWGAGWLLLLLLVASP